MPPVRLSSPPPWIITACAAMRVWFCGFAFLFRHQPAYQCHIPASTATVIPPVMRAVLPNVPSPPRDSASVPSVGVNLSVPTPALTSLFALSPHPAYDWLKSIPCHVPCWEGIIPGQTLVTHARTQLARSPSIHLLPDAELSPGVEQGNIAWYWTGIDRMGGHVRFSLQSTAPRVDAIAFAFPHPVTLADFTHAFGEPSDVIAVAVDSTTRPDYRLYLIYLSLGMMTGQISGDNTAVIGPATLIDSVQIFCPRWTRLG